MKKTAFIAPTYPVLSETFIQTEVDSIRECGHPVCVFAFELEETQSTFDYDVIKIGENFRLFALAQFKYKNLLTAAQFVRNQSSLPMRSLLVYGAKLATQLAEHNVEHVHAHFCQHTTAHAIVAAKLLGISCSFVAHGHDVYESPFDVGEKLAACDFAVAVCRDMLDDFKNMAGKNIKLLHCGVKTEQFTYTPKIPRPEISLVFLGRLVEQKGVQHLLEAMAPVAEKLNIFLDIVGTGDLEAELKQQVQRLGLSDRVRFCGAKPHDWVKKSLPNYDCLVAPFCMASTGNVDTGPLVLKEAMAVGTPVITTDIMGCKEIVTPETGFVVHEKDVTALRASIVQFSQLSFSQRVIMGRLAHERVQVNFNAQLQARKLSRWIENPV
jgi:glycosyltransferase involved in cell wall biosynthesis